MEDSTAEALFLVTQLLRKRGDYPETLRALEQELVRG
jgi:hypothetical protein